LASETGQKNPDPDFLYAALDTTACAAFIKESRMNFAEANNSKGNPGESAAYTCRAKIARFAF
jgi:hypothetical protein